MIKSLQLQILLMRLFGRIKTADSGDFAVRHNLDSPFSLMSRYAKKAGFICFGWLSHILQIPKSVNFSQIVKLVICLVSILVINVRVRPFAGDVHPSKTMRKLFFVMYGYRDIALRMFRASNFSSQIRPPIVLLPNKNTSQSIVMQGASEVFNSAWAFVRHDVYFTMKVAK